MGRDSLEAMAAWHCDRLVKVVCLIFFKDLRAEIKAGGGQL